MQIVKYVIKELLHQNLQINENNLNTLFLGYAKQYQQYIVTPYIKEAILFDDFHDAEEFLYDYMDTINIDYCYFVIEKIYMFQRK